MPFLVFQFRLTDPEELSGLRALMCCEDPNSCAVLQDTRNGSGYDTKRDTRGSASKLASQRLQVTLSCLLRCASADTENRSCTLCARFLLPGAGARTGHAFDCMCLHRFSLRLYSSWWQLQVSFCESQSRHSPRMGCHEAARGPEGVSQGVSPQVLATVC